jgi:hypothetical protein
MLDPVIDNSLYVEDEPLVLLEREFYNVLRVLQCFGDTGEGICNRIIEPPYVTPELQSSTIRVMLKDFQPLRIRLRGPRHRVPGDILVRAFHKIFVLHAANLLLHLLPSFALP